MSAIKFSKQYVQPNPHEVDYWVDITSNPYGGNIKYYNGYDWVDLLNVKGKPVNLDAYYNKTQINQMLSNKASVDSVNSKVDDAEVANVIKNIEFKDRGDEGVEMVVLKYNDMTVGVTLPIASNTTSGIVTKKSFNDFVKQNQLQGVYSEMYDKLSEIRQQYQRKLKAGKNIQIDSDNTIHVVGEVSEVDLSSYAKKTDLDGLASEEWVEDKGYLTEHQDISGKQDVIDDLETIRQGASKGATALQSDSLFIGTQQEYDKVYAEGGIKMGALVIILNESDKLEDTIALLGTAIIGRMVLGKS